MTVDKLTPQARDTEDTITEFEVGEGGVLSMANYAEAVTRADFYDSVADFWSESPKDLAYAMDACRPLAWAVEEIYANFRDDLSAELEDAYAIGRDQAHVAALETQLAALPEEREQGAVDWLVSLSSPDFERLIVPVINRWFNEEPDWSFEDEYLPESGTAHGAALEFFRDTAPDEGEILGVEVIEGTFPGSTYYAAELRGDIGQANRVAEAAGIPIRFVAAQEKAMTQNRSSKQTDEELPESHWTDDEELPESHWTDDEVPEMTPEQMKQASRNTKAYWDKISADLPPENTHPWWLAGPSQSAERKPASPEASSEVDPMQGAIDQIEEFGRKNWPKH